MEDADEGILPAAERYNESEPVNLGSAFEIRIQDLAEFIVRLTGFEGKIVWDTTKPNGQPRRKLDTSRAGAAVWYVANGNEILALRCAKYDSTFGRIFDRYQQTKKGL